jgi:hypothetical protein
MLTEQYLTLSGFFGDDLEIFQAAESLDVIVVANFRLRNLSQSHDIILLQSQLLATDLQDVVVGQFGLVEFRLDEFFVRVVRYSQSQDVRS